jgi:hypothetical protein
MVKWLFLPTAKGWEWHRIDSDGKLSKSASTFATKRECVEDAKRHGYTTAAMKHSANRKRR